MLTKPSLETPSTLKDLRLRKIVFLLKTEGPLETKEIAAAIPNVSIHAINHSLEELLIARNICKVHSAGKPKNVKAYEYCADYGSKTDMVSAALSHPLHRIITSFVNDLS